MLLVLCGDESAVERRVCTDALLFLHSLAECVPGYLFHLPQIMVAGALAIVMEGIASRKSRNTVCIILKQNE